MRRFLLVSLLATLALTPAFADARPRDRDRDGERPRRERIERPPPRDADERPRPRRDRMNRPPVQVYPGQAPRPRRDSLGAGWRQTLPEARQGVRRGQFVPLSRVLPELHRRSPGRQLDAGLENWAGRPVYRVRWGTRNGRRMDYIVDARTGAILGVEGQ